MSPTIDGPRLIRPDEFGDAMSHTEQCFGFDSGELEARLPHCFNDSHPERHAIIKRDETVVSHVACIPVKLQARDAHVECHGIAGVATDPDYRGNGHMTQLLEFWLDRADENGVPLMELEGNRELYGPFGWENAGRERTYRITQRSFGTESTRPDAVRSYRGEADLQLIQQIHGDERYRVRRNRHQYNRLLGQNSLETLIFDSSRPAYLCYRGEDPASVFEFGGSREGVATLLEQVLEMGTEIDIYTHPHHSLVPLFHNVAANWSLHPHRKLNIRDLPKLIGSYAPLFEERWSTVRDGLDTGSGSVTLRIVDDCKPTESVTISHDGLGIHVERAERDSDIELNRHEMTHLLFGSSDACRSIKRSHPFLATILPLEYYFWQTETI